MIPVFQIFIGGVSFFAGVTIAGFRTMRGTNRGIIERLGKFHKFTNPGLFWIMPFIDRLISIDVTEGLVNVSKQEVITSDGLNALVSAQVYVMIDSSPEGLKNSQYKVSDVYYQIVNLTKTTLRDVIGSMTVVDVNSKRKDINAKLLKSLSEETKQWGITIVRAELKEVIPPKDVQVAMNGIVISKNDLISSKNKALAAKELADGEKEAAIKIAEGHAKAIALVSDAAEKSFTEKAMILKQLEVTQAVMQENTKWVFVNPGQQLNLVMDSTSSEDKKRIFPVSTQVVKNGSKK